jgi:hypothetical protein
MMTVRLYKYSDSLAPVHPSSTQGSLAALLRACLVSGYGTKEAAGWEELFTATPAEAVFRPTVGLERQCYRVGDPSAAANVAVINGYESMQDLTTGSGGWGGVNFGKQYSAGASQQWYVVADERTCWVFLQTNGGDFVAHGFGAFDSLVADNPWASFLSGHTLSTNLPTATTGTSLAISVDLGSATAQAILIHRPVMSVIPPGTGLGALGCASGVDGHGTFGKGPSGVAPTADWYLQPVFLSEYSSNTYYRHVAGVMRGLYYPLTFRPVSNGQTVTINGRDYLAINTVRGGQFLVDITGWS